MTEWQSLAIGELGRVVTGKTPPAARPEAFGRDYPFVTPTDMVDQRFMTRTDRYLSSEGADLLRRLKVPAGSLMVSCIGWQLGKVAVSTSEAFTNQQINTIVPDSSKVDPGFLYYHLRTRRGELKRLASGGTRTPILNKSRFAALTVPLPPRQHQERIAHVLGVLDDLIENNRRRVEVLEEMARAIYREWFLKFRYPGYEDVPLVNSALGPIPDGWTASTLAAIADMTMGQSPKSEFYNNEGIGKPFHQGVADFGSHFPTSRKWCSVDGRSAFDGDVLISVRAPVGRINIADTDITIGRGLAAVRAKDSRQGLLLGHLRKAFAEEDSMGNDGAIFKSLGKAEFASIPVLVPPDAVADAANAALSENLATIRALSQAAQRLSAMRDLLLPKLVSGKIDVSTLDLDALIDGQVA